MINPTRSVLVGLLACLILPHMAWSQRQLPDLEFAFENASPAFAPGTGPEILLSTTNSNFVARGSLRPLAMIAASDGFAVRVQDLSLGETLEGFEGILVIANPYLDTYWQHPAMEPPSAFSEEEIEAVRSWVENGGSLLLLADHAPLGGGSSALAAAFGFTFLNGHAVDGEMARENFRRVNIEFTPENGLNPDHPITDGSTGIEPIERFFCFGGQAYIPAEGAQPLLTIPQGWEAVFTYKLEDEIATAMRIDASGMAQGATLEYGDGRLAVFGEAGAFSAQIIDGVLKFGFNTEEGSENPQFVLATLRWLSGYRP